MPPSLPISLAGRLTARPFWRREAVYAIAAIAAAAAAAFYIVFPRIDPAIRDHPVVFAGHAMTRVDFADIPGFEADDLTAAIEPFLRSCAKGRSNATYDSVCARAAGVSGSDPDEAHAWFTGNFVAYRIDPADGEGTVTAYYEPVVPGSRVKTQRFATPLYAMPADLVPVTDANRPKGWDERLTSARQTGAGLVPFATRAEIDDGALAGKAKPLVYVENAVEAFYIHIQGSTRISLPDGTLMRVGFAGKNGHPYASISKAMQEKGIRPEGGFSMDGMRAWFADNPDRTAEILQANPSYIFFREVEGLAPDLGPIGGEGVPLTTGRSIAVDTAYHGYGTPIFIDASVQSGPGRAREPFRRLMIAQDTGSAIKGPARADLFWGTGKQAGSTAGGIKAAGTFYVLLPKP